MKGAKCPHCESTIPMFHVFFKGKNLSKEQRYRNRKTRSPGYKLSCLQCEREFEIKAFGIIFLFILSSFLGSLIFSFIFHVFVNRFLPIPVDGWLGTWFLRQLFSLVVFILMLKLLNGRFITTWPIREISE